jgi:bloom syndrome protein
MALTATANAQVKEDVKRVLKIPKALELTQSFNRPNLRYEVRKKPSPKEMIKTIAGFIRKGHANECGIIYCFSRRDCEETSYSLSQLGIKSMHYHAKMDPADREQVQKDWQKGEYHVICATIAFGMGIDQAAVRYVIHFSLPASMEGYYQETGRAGRDGKDSLCVLFYSCG